LLGYYAAAWSNRGMEAAAAGRASEAVGDYQAALLIDPGLAVAYNNWGIVAYNRGDWAKARSLYGQALRLDPQNAGFQRNFAWAQRADLPRN